MQTAKWTLKAAVATAIVALPWTAHGEGLKADLENVPWARWQARLSFGTLAPTWRTGLESSDRNGLTLRGVSLMGDYYFSRSMTTGGIASGFRATSGLILGPRSGLWVGRPGLAPPGAVSVDRRVFDLGVDANADSATVPYVGVGYSGLSTRGGWSVSADLGLAALAPGNAVKLGRAAGGTQGVDDLLRELRLSPIVQLGVSYSF